MKIKFSFKLISLLLVLSFMLSSASAFALDITGTGACVLDFNTGTVIYEKNADTARPPASMTKIMTLYIIFEKLADGTLSKETLIPVSKHAAYLTKGGDAANIPLTAGDSYTVDELINALVVKSACACATVIAEYFSGSEWAFAQLMNEKASQLGLSAYFDDASGLSPNNRITPRSMAELVRLFIKNYPDILNYTSKQSVKIRGINYESTNKMLFPKNAAYYPFTDGFKTGTTNAAGYCFSATASNGTNRIISITMNSSGTNSRFTDTRKMLDYGFSYVANLPAPVSTITDSVIYSTDIRTFINDYEIPCFYYFGENPALVLCAEQLGLYGFDVNYSSEENAVYIYPNSSKEIFPVDPGDKTPGIACGNIFKNSGLRIFFCSEGTETELKTVISLNGQCCISVDELGSFFSYEWIDNARHAKIITKTKNAPLSIEAFDISDLPAASVSEMEDK